MYPGVIWIDLGGRCWGYTEVQSLRKTKESAKMQDCWRVSIPLLRVHSKSIHKALSVRSANQGYPSGIDKVWLADKCDGEWDTNQARAGFMDHSLASMLTKLRLMVKPQNRIGR
jgi:hypothetical protein